ncbi:MAG TPA: hypothetical protein PKA38_03460 [Candidatus Levybacteria bacterium]|nr:hypothetical protein [Candidatus Levybacteria bacterium]
MITTSIVLVIIFINFLLFKTRWKRKTYGIIFFTPLLLLLAVLAYGQFGINTSNGLGEGLAMLALMLFTVVILVLLPFILPIPLYRFLKNKVYFALCYGPVVLFLIFILTSESQLGGFSQEVLTTFIQKLP